MIVYKLAVAAAADLDEIFEYGIEVFGLSRATEYLTGLSDTIEILSSHPKLGHRADALSEGLRRLKHNSHVVFYRLSGGCIHVVRILHGRLDIDDQVKDWLTEPIDRISEQISTYA